MHLPFTMKKSGGIPVRPEAHRKIAQGNAARDRKDWPAAQQAYRAALAGNPNLAHIWIQLGHAAKESGKLLEANQAYLKAAELTPRDSDPFLHLGHAAKLAGDMPTAGQHYAHAVQLDPANFNAVSELHRMLARATGRTREALVKLLQATIPDDPDEPNHPAIPRPAATLLAALPQTPDQAALVFDVSDLIGFFGYARLPTGIQRVQIETIIGALETGRSVQVCCFINGRDDWLEVPLSQFRRLARLSMAAGDTSDPEWLAALNRLHLTLAITNPIEFPRGATLVNLGTSGWMQNYFLHVRHAKMTAGIRYIPFVHDLIPIIKSEHFVPNLVQDFISWAVGVFAHADHYLVNSKATRRDLLKVAETLGAPINERDVVVIPLDADFRKPDAATLPHQMLAQWNLDARPFVLMVGTIEPRKGHIVALDAWIDLIRRHGPAKVPKLVCVGRNGWLNDEIYRLLDRDPQLNRNVAMLSNLSDEQLSLLYRSCLFTIYPSQYEGWGLPITESLCYGKPVITCDNSSLPEAGGPFAVYVETGSAAHLANAVERMSFDAPYRQAIAARIAAEFHPRTWTGIAHQINDEVVGFMARDAQHQAPTSAPMAKLGAYYPLSRNTELRIWPGLGSGEIFRTGRGWLWPEAWGCWTAPQGGAMRIGLPGQGGRFRVYLRLRGLPTIVCPWTIQVKGNHSATGTLLPGELRIIGFDCQADDDTLQIRLRGAASETIHVDNAGGRDSLASVGVAGFILHAAEDLATRASLLDTVVFGNLEQLNPYREQSLNGPDTAELWDEDEDAPTRVDIKPGLA